jgi:hypothetical protein
MAAGGGPVGISDPPVVASQVAGWWANDLDAGHADADPVSTWTDRIGSFAATSSGSNRPVFYSSTRTINGQPVVDFNGSSHRLQYTASNAVSTANGGCYVAVFIGDAGDGFFWSSSDLAVSNRWIGGLLQAANGYGAIYQRDATEKIVRGNTDIADGSTAYVVEVSSTSTAYAIRVNNVSESLTNDAGVNNGDWFSDTSSRDVFSIGTLQRSSGYLGYFNGALAYLMIADATLSSGDRTALYGWINATYGI